MGKIRMYWKNKNVKFVDISKIELKYLIASLLDTNGVGNIDSLNVSQISIDSLTEKLENLYYKGDN